MARPFTEDENSGGSTAVSPLTRSGRMFHERVAAASQPPRELQQLLVGHHGDAPVVDVHDGARRLAVEPLEEATLLLPEVGAEAEEMLLAHGI